MAFLNVFSAMITSVVCFVTCVTRHSEICTNNLRKFDVHCGKLLRLVVGPPAKIDWNQPWHTLLHAWHKCIDQQMKYLGFKIWSAKYLSESSKWATVRELQLTLLYVALLPLTLLYFLQVAGKCILDSQLGGGRPGASFSQWQTTVQNFCRLILATTPISGSNATQKLFFSSAMIWWCDFQFFHV